MVTYVPTFTAQILYEYIENTKFGLWVTYVEHFYSCPGITIDDTNDRGLVFHMADESYLTMFLLKYPKVLIGGYFINPGW